MTPKEIVAERRRHGAWGECAECDSEGVCAATKLLDEVERLNGVNIDYVEHERDFAVALYAARAAEIERLQAENTKLHRALDEVLKASELL